CSRILLRDSSQTLYLRGLNPEAPSLAKLIDLLRQEIDRLAPEKVICIGTSGGGFAAILAGHLLKVDQVHAFGPTVYASIWAVLRNRDWHQLRNRWYVLLAGAVVLPRSVKRLLDLKPVLNDWNGRTNYTIHVCTDNPVDLGRAEYLSECPHVRLARYDCKGHSVTNHLVRERLLAKVLQEVGAPMERAPSSPEAVTVQS
ncbi:MAG TPA: hypothetical protein VHM24_13340, partial [Gemmatimonadaceae bacterium]|nr:hypothetical protein [Gemmatimonadaceae bacterium]